ncbi:MAG: methyltransferase domain-containing protein [Planctomycetaceae bacterium]|nr:methyltransferase domain-containing protein [Planctomycetaceae bacterium]
MTAPHGYPGIPGGYVEEVLDLGGRTVRYRRPAEPDALLAVPEVVAAFDRDGDAPYWPLLWPPAVPMARAVAAAEWKVGTTVLEVGCGIGLASLAAASTSKWNVTASDRQADAVMLAVANGELNGFAIEGLVLDWHHPIERRFDLILGCEVIYDDRLHAPLLAMLDHMLADDGDAWLADHGRMHAPLFADRARDAGFAVSLMEEDGKPLSDFRTAAYQLLKLRRE